MVKSSGVKQLNSAQQRVVDHTNGPLLVVAGAGTGKTGVIVERINKLLNDGIEAKRILAVTFTEKAAAEMLERVLEARQGFETELPILTFNGYGESLLREFNTDAGLSRNFLLLGENARIVFLQQHLKDLKLDYYSPVSNPVGLLPDLANYFSKLKQHAVTADEYEQFVSTMPQNDESEKLEKCKHQELARAFKNYMRLCKEQNVIDYDDQIYRVIELLKARPNIQAELQARYHTVMIDEFQDTNPMQSQLVDLLVGADKNLVVVGDDDQSIYGFRGATLANILQFKQRYPETEEVTLTENYRSSQAILDASYQLVQNNNPHRLEATLSINKKLHGQLDGPVPVLKNFAMLDHELQWIAKDIATRLEAGEQPGDIAVLCRRNATAQQISQQLALHDIEHVIIGERYQLYQTEVVRLLVEALRAVADAQADTSLYHTLSGALFNVAVKLLATLGNQAKREYKSLSEIIESQEDAQYEDLKKATAQIQEWQDQVATLSVGRLVYKIIDETGYKDRLSNEALSDQEAGNTILQLSDFFRTLKEFESIALQPTTLQYLESYEVLQAAGESNEDGTLQVSKDKVNILTIHKAKGLEWQTVYIPDCTESSFPLKARPGGIAIPEQLVAKSSSEADAHMPEERRLMYVALTRAKQNLLLSYSERHYSQTVRKPSRFLGEIFDEETIEHSAVKSGGEQPKLEISDPAVESPTPVSVPKSIYDGTTIHLSVSQITTFIHCPLDFYYRFVLCLPDEPSAAASYGTTIHSLIEDINNALISGQPLELATLEQKLEASWKPLGYISKDHQQRAKQQALQTLKHFYATHFLEQKVVPYAVESPFSLLLKPENIRIKGRLDVVFESEAGIEIRDYKTSSSVTTPAKAKSRASSSDQLTLYALIWQELHGELPAKLSLEFVDTQLVGEVRKTQRGIDTMRGKIAAAVESIKNNEFKPDKDHRYCRHPEL